MKKKFSITLLVTAFSLFIIGFGGAITAEAAGKCLDIASVNMTGAEFVDCASDSVYQAANPELLAGHRFAADSGVTDARIWNAFEADAARYAGMAALYTNNNETNARIRNAFEADAARYAGLAALYANNNETNARIRSAFEADAARYTGLATLYAK